VVQAADADSLFLAAQGAFAAAAAIVPPLVDPIITSITLTGAGDGHMFFLELEMAAAANVDGGADVVDVQFLLSATAEDLQKQIAALQSGQPILDVQIAGAAKGQRVMAMVLFGTVRPSGGGNACTSNNLTITGLYACAENDSNTASGQASFAIGTGTFASGNSSHSQGNATQAAGSNSRASGSGAWAQGSDASAEGTGNTQAIGEASHAEGSACVACGRSAHSEGEGGGANGRSSHTEGASCRAGRLSYGFSVAAGLVTVTIAGGDATADFPLGVAVVIAPQMPAILGSVARVVATPPVFAAGDTTFDLDFPVDALTTVGVICATDQGEAAHAEGSGSVATAYASHSEGFETKATGYVAHAEGYQTIASGGASHAEGANTTSGGESSHSEGQNTVASGSDSHAEGDTSVASGHAAHAEGQGTQATGADSHAEGGDTQATGAASHAEGRSADGHPQVASGAASHVEGTGNNARGESAHAEGERNLVGYSPQPATLTAGGTTITMVGDQTFQFPFGAAGGPVILEPTAPVAGPPVTVTVIDCPVWSSGPNETTFTLSAPIDVTTTGVNVSVPTWGQSAHAEGAAHVVLGAWSNAKGIRADALSDNTMCHGGGKPNPISEYGGRGQFGRYVVSDDFVPPGTSAFSERLTVWGGTVGALYFLRTTFVVSNETGGAWFAEERRTLVHVDSARVVTVLTDVIAYTADPMATGITTAVVSGGTGTLALSITWPVPTANNETYAITAEWTQVSSVA
jgi:hypothetical protein